MSLLSRLRRSQRQASTAVWGGARRATLVIDPRSARACWHGRLAGAGPFDLVVDDSGLAEGAADRFRASFLHLRPGGRYRVPAAHAEDVVRVAKAEFAGAVADLHEDEAWVEVRRQGRTLAKVLEPEMNAALAEDPLRGGILATVPGSSFDARCVRRSSREERMSRYRSRYDAPDLFLREYLDVVCRPKSVVEQRGLLTPDTYRHHQGKQLRHMSLRDVSPMFVEAPRRPAADALEGTYFHLDNEHRGYFGHALTEQVSRLWGWRPAQEQFPPIRALVSLNRGRPVAEWEWTLMEAAGVPRDQVVVIDGPVRVERLLAATPMFSLPTYVHPRIVETWDDIGSTLRTRARPGAGAGAERIFCSRRHDKRACLNRAEVEGLFTEFGFEVVFPEEHPLPDQVAMFHDADVIAGFAGSAMFTSMFTDRVKTLVLVTPDTYRPSNEYMISAVRGHRLFVAVGTTPTVLPEGVSPAKPPSWPFSVDLADEGVWLRGVLAKL